MACFALDNHPLVFGETVNVHPVLHPILIKTCGVEKITVNCTLKKRFEMYTHKLGPKKVATLYLEATAKINQFWTRGLPLICERAKVYDHQYQDSCDAKHSNAPEKREES